MPRDVLSGAQRCGGSALERFASRALALVRQLCAVRLVVSSLSSETVNVSRRCQGASRLTGGLIALCGESPRRASSFITRRRESCLSASMSTLSPFEDLLTVSRELEARAKAVQGERHIEVGEADLTSLADDYHAWLARALEVLPSG